jgi:hypothetical protein
MKSVLAFLLLLPTVNVYAEQVSLIQMPEPQVILPPAVELPIKEEDVPKQQVPDENFLEMKAFMKEQDVRLKAIKLLNLDVARADLELKRREIESKLAGLNQSSSTSMQMSMKDSDTSIHVASILISPKKREALLQTGGLRSRVQEGSKINDKTVSKIEADAVTFKDINGNTETIKFES